MWKFRLSVIVALGTFALAGGPAALAASGGDPNAGDVWVDNAGQPAGPGHEMDPHLACGQINLYGAGLADSSGTYTIDGWPPSGSQEAVESNLPWSYNTSTGGTQTISSFDGQTLVNDAAAMGDTAAAQGFHFKLDFSQDPQKHKTFWINCTPTSPTPSSGSTQSNSTPSSSTQSSSTQSPAATSGTSSPSTTSSTAPRASVKAKHLRRARARRHHKKHRGLVKPHRRHRAPRHSVKAVNVAAAEFTG